MVLQFEQLTQATAEVASPWSAWSCQCSYPRYVGCGRATQSCAAHACIRRVPRIGFGHTCRREHRHVQKHPGLFEGLAGPLAACQTLYIACRMSRATHLVLVLYHVNTHTMTAGV